MQESAAEPIKIFFCYAHEDEGFLDGLKDHMAPLERLGKVQFWHDRDISAGDEWEQAIAIQLKKAEIFLLLVSPDFFKSDYCYSVEMAYALERAQQREITIIPIIVRPCMW